MTIDEKTLDRIAELARLDFSDPEKRKAMLADMQRVLDLVAQLNAVDTKGVEPLIFLGDEEDVLREDVAQPGLSRQDVLRNAPVKDSDYFKMPKVVGGKG